MRRNARSASAVRPVLPVRELQLATLVKAAPEGEDWVHEIKFDGYRICAVVKDGAARLYTRKFLDWTPSMQPVADALATLPVRAAILDGEVCTLMTDGRSSFPGLHEALGNAGAELVYMVFDVLEIEGEDLTKLPLEERKARLAALLGPAGKSKKPPPWQAHVRYSDHITGSGGDFFRLACERGLEGIISKQRRDPYRAGRGASWVKTKCLQRQELVIAGYTEPSGGRIGFGALLVGHFEGEALRYAGKVGTGFGSAMLDELYRAMATREVTACPFTPAPARAKTGPGVHWVKPELVAEIAFMEWTPDGALRHPSFQALRYDKPAREVRRERAG